MRSFKKCRIAAMVVLALLVVRTSAQSDAPKSVTPNPRIGVFDSRAVAIAYYRSDEFKKRLQDMHMERDKAKKAGDEKAVARWESDGQALQEKVHKQGFGTARIDGILTGVKDQIAVIAKAADVHVIVSKWDIAFQSQEVELVDVTANLVKLWNPDQATLDAIRDIQTRAPVSDDKIKPRP